MQANTFSQNSNFTLILITFVGLTGISLVSTLAIQILPEILELLPYIRQELSKLVSQSLYIR